MQCSTGAASDQSLPHGEIRAAVAGNHRCVSAAARFIDAAIQVKKRRGGAPTERLTMAENALALA